MEIKEIVAQLNSDSDKGISDKEAKLRLKKYGKNELPKIKRGFLRIYLAPLFSWLIVIYLVGALLIYFFSVLEGKRDLSDVYITLAIVAVNMLVAIFQQFRASKKLKALKEIIAPTTTVIRDGSKKKILAKEVVIGDLVYLEQGAKVPADARIISCSNLEMNESSLTGESESVKKISESLPNKELSISEQSNIVFSGTFVTLGTGKAIVIKTGANTEIGKISKNLKEAGVGSIPLQKKMNNFGKWLGVLVILFWFLVLIFKWILSGFKELEFITSLIAAMDIMPINIPLLTTIILLTGVLTMAKHGVVIRNLASVDSLGRISVICADKTGTLTQNKMVIEYINTNDFKFKVTGNGYAPYGDFYRILENSNELLQIKPLEFPLVLKLILQAGYLNNNASIIKKQIKINSKIIENWDVIGSPTEGALITLYKKAFEDIDLKQFDEIIEFPFDSSLKRMSKVFYSKKYNQITVFTKGASEIIIPLCTKIMQNQSIIDFKDSDKQKFLSEINFYESKGYRILSLAYKIMTELPTKNQSNSREFVESDLIYLGYVTIIDPPRQYVKESVHQCYDAGINVVMITGDSPITARFIAKQIDIIQNDNELVIEGKNIDNLKVEESLNNIKVFARVDPIHKEKIVKMFQSQNKVVAMTGDGINDALALNLADAGIAMGVQGTDVAKEAADMIISDDSFNSIVTGIKEGRGIFSRIRAVVFFFIVTNLFEGVVQFIVVIFLKMPYFLTGVFFKQWMFLSVTAHMFPGLILTFDTLDKEVMKQKPRNSQEILDKITVKLMVQYGILLACSMITIYLLVIYGIIPLYTQNYEFGSQNPYFMYSDYFDLNYYFNSPEEYLEFIDICNKLNLPANLNTLRLFGKTLTMLMLVLFFCESILALQIRRPNKSLLKSLKQDFPLGALIVIGFIFGCFMALMYVPKAQLVFVHLFNINFMFMYLAPIDWLIAFLCSLICIGGFELVKYFNRKKGKFI